MREIPGLILESIGVNALDSGDHIEMEPLTTRRGELTKHCTPN